MTPRPWLASYSEWVPQQLPLPQSSVIDQFEQTVAARPGDPALHYFESSIRFAELNEQANRFAHWLARHGVGRGDRIAVVTQNDPEFAVAQLGAWKRAAIVVPLNPMFKAKELDYHLRDSGARALVVLAGYREEHRDAIAGSLVECVLTTRTGGDFYRVLAAESGDSGARLAVGPEDIAQLVYTSGTTGPPKGAIGLHRNIALNAEFFRQWMRMGDGDVILGAAPLFHITGLVAQLALCYISGVPLVLYHRFDAATTFNMVKRWRTTFCVAAITAYIALMNDPASASASFTSMTKCYSGGAPVSPSTAEQFQAKLGPRIHNIYGLTESNSPSHATPLGVQGPIDPSSGALAIGLPIPNLDARIVDLADPSRELAPGETGELAMRGPMMFPGYWNKPEATATAFHDGWFLTGDVAMMDDGGWFYVVDRKKDMIVASGFKVWPRDVEDVLYQHRSVRECAVIGVPDAYRGETVKAFVALKQGESATPEEIISFCRERLAAYKYPGWWSLCPRFPRPRRASFLGEPCAEREPKMLNAQIFGTKNSQDTRAAERFFKERRVPIHLVDLKVKPMARGEINHFIQRFGLTGLLDAGGKAYIDAGLAYMKLSEADLLSRIERAPALLRLPLVRCGNRFSVGRDEDAWQAMAAGAGA